jgi:hypothetical protein
MTTESFRQLSDYENAVLARLLDIEFPGHLELQEQVLHSVVRPMETNDNYGSIIFNTTSQTIAAVKDRVPVIGMTKDESGGHVEILLHVVNGKIAELEFVRMDGQPMNGLPRLDILQLEVRGGMRPDTSQ